MSQLMARDLRMNTELRKIILEEDDEDEDNLSRQVLNLGARNFRHSW
jgi:esterase/lipase superfamily enzyme